MRDRRGRPQAALTDTHVFLRAHVHENAWEAWEVFTHPEQGFLWGGHGVGESHTEILSCSLWHWYNLK